MTVSFNPDPGGGFPIFLLRVTWDDDGGDDDDDDDGDDDDGDDDAEILKVVSAVNTLVLFFCPCCANFWSVYAHRMCNGA